MRQIGKIVETKSTNIYKNFLMYECLFERLNVSNTGIRKIEMPTNGFIFL